MGNNSKCVPALKNNNDLYTDSDSDIYDSDSYTDSVTYIMNNILIISYR